MKSVHMRTEKRRNFTFSQIEEQFRTLDEKEAKLKKYYKPLEPKPGGWNIPIIGTRHRFADFFLEEDRIETILRDEMQEVSAPENTSKEKCRRASGTSHRVSVHPTSSPSGLRTRSSSSRPHSSTTSTHRRADVSDRERRPHSARATLLRTPQVVEVRPPLASALTDRSVKGGRRREHSVQIVEDPDREEAKGPPRPQSGRESEHRRVSYSQQTDGEGSASRPPIPRPSFSAPRERLPWTPGISSVPAKKGRGEGQPQSARGEGLGLVQSEPSIGEEEEYLMLLGEEEEELEDTGSRMEPPKLETTFLSGKFQRIKDQAMADVQTRLEKTAANTKAVNKENRLRRKEEEMGGQVGAANTHIPVKSEKKKEKELKLEKSHETPIYSHSPITELLRQPVTQKEAAEVHAWSGRDVCRHNFPDPPPSRQQPQLQPGQDPAATLTLSNTPDWVVAVLPPHQQRAAKAAKEKAKREKEAAEQARRRKPSLANPLKLGVQLTAWKSRSKLNLDQNESSRDLDSQSPSPFDKSKLTLLTPDPSVGQSTESMLSFTPSTKLSTRVKSPVNSPLTPSTGLVSPIPISLSKSRRDSERSQDSVGTVTSPSYSSTRKSPMTSSFTSRRGWVDPPPESWEEVEREEEEEEDAEWAPGEAAAVGGLWAERAGQRVEYMLSGTRGLRASSMQRLSNPTQTLPSSTTPPFYYLQVGLREPEKLSQIAKVPISQLKFDVLVIDIETGMEERVAEATKVNSDNILIFQSPDGVVLSPSELLRWITKPFELCDQTVRVVVKVVEHLSVNGLVVLNEQVTFKEDFVEGPFPGYYPVEGILRCPRRVLKYNPKSCRIGSAQRSSTSQPSIDVRINALAQSSRRSSDVSDPQQADTSQMSEASARSTEARVSESRSAEVLIESPSNSAEKQQERRNTLSSRVSDHILAQLDFQDSGALQEMVSGEIKPGVLKKISRKKDATLTDMVQKVCLEKSVQIKTGKTSIPEVFGNIFVDSMQITDRLLSPKSKRKGSGDSRGSQKKGYTLRATGPGSPANSQSLSRFARSLIRSESSGIELEIAHNSTEDIPGILNMDVSNAMDDKESAEKTPKSMLKRNITDVIEDLNIIDDDGEEDPELSKPHCPDNNNVLLTHRSGMSIPDIEDEISNDDADATTQDGDEFEDQLERHLLKSPEKDAEVHLLKLRNARQAQSSSRPQSAHPTKARPGSARPVSAVSKRNQETQGELEDLRRKMREQMAGMRDDLTKDLEQFVS